MTNRWILILVLIAISAPLFEVHILGVKIFETFGVAKGMLLALSLLFQGGALALLIEHVTKKGR